MEDQSKHSADKTDSVRATCLTCDAIVGEFYNRWHRIAGADDYVLPALLGSFRISGVTRARGKSQQAQRLDESIAGSELDSWCVQSNSFIFVILAAFCTSHITPPYDFVKRADLCRIPYYATRPLEMSRFVSCTVQELGSNAFLPTHEQL